MKKIYFILLIIVFLFLSGFLLINTLKQTEEEKILSYTVDLKIHSLNFYLKDNNGRFFSDFKNLSDWLDDKNEKLVFATNGGMFKPGKSPQGLYIENGSVLNSLNTSTTGYGNFYLQPNGVFYTTKNNKACICATKEIENFDTIKFATQSGPMLVNNGNIHPKFIKESKNSNIRNGVGILPDGKILFALSKEKINFYDFALYFKNKGCKQALYLDGFISKVYLPEQGYTILEGDFGVIIGVTKLR